MASTPRPLGVALVGYDGVGTQNHQFDMYERGLSAHPAFEIRAVTDAPVVRDDRRRFASEAADRLGVPYVEDLEAALRREDIDVLSVCVGFDQRVPVIQQAAARGKHVLVDKPMALELEEVDAIDRATRDGAINCVPAHHHRFLDEVVAARDLFRGSVLGELVAVHADFIVTRGATRATFGDPEVWPLGELMNFAVYPIDVIRAATGLEVRRVHGSRGGFFYGGEDDEDLGVLTLTLDRDVLATVTVGRAPITGHPSGGEHRYRFVGSDDLLVLDLKRAAARISTAERTWQSPYLTGSNSVVAMLDELHHAITEGRSARIGPDDARVGLAATLAARRSAEEGRVVSL